MESHARSLHDIFAEWNTHHAGVRWKDYWQHRWENEIKEMLALNWKLIRIVHNKKVPYASSHGSLDETLSYDQAVTAVKDGSNLAVVCRYLILVEADTTQIDPRLSAMITKTRVARTPRGFHFYTRTPFNPDLWRRLKESYPYLDNPRGNPAYALVPLSSCFLERKGVRIPDSGPARVYEWISRAPIMQFEKFAWELIGK